MKYLSATYFILAITLMISRPGVSQDQVIYQKGDTLQIVIPRVFTSENMGEAYVESVTGLRGTRITNNRERTKNKTEYLTSLHKVTDGLLLNAWGTGLGMYEKELDAGTDIRRARFVIMKILKSDELTGFTLSAQIEETAKPLLLTGIDYGYSFNLSISGPKSRFTNEVYKQLEEAIAREESIEPILQNYDLAGTFALRGITSKFRNRQIPVSWQDLLQKYELTEPTVVFGRYILLTDLKAQKIAWPN